MARQPDRTPAGGAPHRRLLIGIDTGGTFVDTVVLDDGGTTVSAKALSAVPNPVHAVISSLEQAAAARGETITDLLGAAARVVYGTTAGLNALLTRRGRRVGLLATRGHEDALLIGRVHQKIAGLTPRQMTDVAHLDKPEPLVPPGLIKGIHERIDARGAVVVPLDEDGVVAAVAALVEAGCEAVAVSYLWSFLNDAHERRTAELVRAHFAELEVSLSCDVAPMLGEYERTAATVVNAYIAGAVAGHLGELEAELTSRGFGGRLQVMQSNGGHVDAVALRDRPLATLGSGPAGGVGAAVGLGRDVITADMGGTSFDVGLVVDGEPDMEHTPVVARLHLAASSIRTRSIGAGGGSVAWIDDQGFLRVGPHSAGSDPGPACFGRGGDQATVTDADLLLGRLDVGARPDPHLRLQPAAAERALKGVAKLLECDPVEAAAGIVAVAEAQMADLLRKVTIEAGHDPRRLVLVAYGGASPLHAGAFGPAAGVSSVIIPWLAPVFSAYGLSRARWKRVLAQSRLRRAPFDPGEMAAAFRDLHRQGEHALDAGGVTGPVEWHRSVDMRYVRQTHRVTVPLGEGTITEGLLAALVERFESSYESIFGSGTGYSQAGIEATTLRLTIVAGTKPPPAPWLAPQDRGLQTTRRAWFDGWVDTPVHRMENLSHGSTIAGPAMVDTGTTTLVVHSHQELGVGDHGDLCLTWTRE